MQKKVYSPPEGPPPGYHAPHSQPYGATSIDHHGEPPPYHNWQEAVPDTTEFPPPPITGFQSSNTGNASSDDAERAHDFCDRVPLYIPVMPSNVVYSAVQSHDICLLPPGEFRGSLSRYGVSWRGSTRDRNGDCVLSTNLPLYFAQVDSPLNREIGKTIYFEVTLIRLRAGPSAGDASGLAIGFMAQPYPTWRSPGWERGSLGVFSDDGCRFVNDSWGGKEFTTAFREGETVGLGMTFALPENISGTAGGHRRPRLNVNVFFTRDGQQVGGWDLHEEVDAESGSVYGLEGDFDLYAGIGLFGGVDFQVCFDPAGWLWHPR